MGVANTDKGIPEMTRGSGHLPGLDYLAIYHDSKNKSGQQDNQQIGSVVIVYIGITC